MPGAETSDSVRLGAIFIEQLEAVETREGSGSAWDLQAWYGGPFNKAWLRSQGDRRGGKTEAASVEALWSRMYHPFWSTQAGVRTCTKGGKDAAFFMLVAWFVITLNVKSIGVFVKFG